MYYMEVPVTSYLKLSDVETWEAQSRQSAKLFLQSSELGHPHHYRLIRVSPLTPFLVGEGTIACGIGDGGVPIPTMGHKLWCSVLGGENVEKIIKNRWKALTQPNALSDKKYVAPIFDNKFS